MSIGGGIRRTVYWTNDCLHGSPVGRHIHEIRKVLNNYDGGVIIQNQ